MPPRREHGDDEVQAGISTSNAVSEDHRNNTDMEPGQDGRAENSGYGKTNL